MVFPCRDHAKRGGWTQFRVVDESCGLSGAIGAISELTVSKPGVKPATVCQSGERSATPTGVPEADRISAHAGATDVDRIPRQDSRTPTLLLTTDRGSATGFLDRQDFWGPTGSLDTQPFSQASQTASVASQLAKRWPRVTLGADDSSWVGGERPRTAQQRRSKPNGALSANGATQVSPGQRPGDTG